MSFGCLKETLRPWMRTQSWHARHDLDDQRFHRALNDAFTKCGCPIPATDLREAMTQLLAEVHPEKQASAWKDVIDNFVQMAGVIGDFVQNTGGPRQT